MREDQIMQNIEGGMGGSKNQPAIYTHCYYDSGTR